MASPAGWGSRRHDQRVATNADQTEFKALQYGDCNFDAGTFDDRIAESLDDFEVSDPGTVPKWVGRDVALDNATSDIGIELSRRQDLLKEHYPFTIETGSLVYKRSKSLVYEFCLAVSEANSLSKGDFAKLPIAFERLVRDVCVKFLGPFTEGIRTGWPSDSLESRPIKFREVVRQISDRFGEWTWSPQLGFDDDPSHRIVKDEGLDFVICKAIPDKRGGRLFFLGQCACGNDFDSKYYEIDGDLKRLSRYIRPVSFAAANRIFAVPRHIPNNIEFCEINSQAGLTFDRIRIVMIAENDAEFFEKQAKIPYRDLIQLVIPEFDPS